MNECEAISSGWEVKPKTCSIGHPNAKYIIKGNIAQVVGTLCHTHYNVFKKKFTLEIIKDENRNNTKSQQPTTTTEKNSK